MSVSFPIHTPESAPEAARPILAGIQASYGMIPNLFGVMASAPPVLASYLAVSATLEQGLLTAAERQLLAIAISEENACHYCVGVHSAVAARQRVLDDATLRALQAAQPLQDARLEALRHFARVVVRERGWASDEVIETFLAAGYEPAHVLEVMAWVALKTLSNYVNHVSETPLDKPFEAWRWSSATAAT